MDFTPDPKQQAVADVVTSVLERDNSWEALVAGGVTALAVPERLGGDGTTGDQRLRCEGRTARVAQPEDSRVAEAGGPRDHAHMSYQPATAPGEVHEHGPLPGHVSAEGTRRRALGHI